MFRDYENAILQAMTPEQALIGSHDGIIQTNDFDDVQYIAAIIFEQFFDGGPEIVDMIKDLCNDYPYKVLILHSDGSLTIRQSIYGSFVYITTEYCEQIAAKEAKDKHDKLLARRRELRQLKKQQKQNKGD